jgi:hypothetical protein
VTRIPAFPRRLYAESSDMLLYFLTYPLICWLRSVRVLVLSWFTTHSNRVPCEPGYSSDKTPIRPLHIEIDGVSKYRRAYSVEDLAALLLSEK